jgi:thymidylate synthase
MLKNDNFNDLYKELIKRVLTYGQEVSPRGIPCYELTPGFFQLTDISKSLLTLKERKLSYSFNAVEKLCYITGKSGEDILPKYAPNIKKFINPSTCSFDGAYGPRLWKQYKYILELLKRDPDTRQAVFNINNYHEDHHDSLDIPCTCSLQFLVRGGKLNLVVYMRSNDLLWGTPYDVSQFTFIQECFAGILGLELGTYTHFVGSLHIYKKDEEKFIKILQNDEIVEDCFLQKPVSAKTWEQVQDQSEMVLANDIYPNSHEFENPLTPFYRNLYEIIYNPKNTTS